jgi:hypothetical protein
LRRNDAIYFLRDFRPRLVITVFRIQEILAGRIYFGRSNRIVYSSLELSPAILIHDSRFMVQHEYICSRIYPMRVS